MPNRFFTVIALAAAMVVFLAPAGHAADVTKISSGPCDWLLTGTIEEGDARKLDVIAHKFEGSTLCLDSPGGSLPEGKRLFDRIWEENIKTRVRARHVCESACALAFLGGSVEIHGTRMSRHQRRVIEPGARLGFHAPGLGLADYGQYSGRQVRTAFEAALDGAEMIFAIKLTAWQTASVMSDFLYQQLLSKRRDDMYYITTIGDALMSDIDIDFADITLPTTIGKSEIANICDNTWAVHYAAPRPDYTSAKEYYAQKREDRSQTTTDTVTVTDEGDYRLGKIAYRFSHTSQVTFGSCSVRLDQYRNPVFKLTKYDEEGEGFSVPDWYILDPATPIADHAASADGRITRADFVEFAGKDLFGGDLPGEVLQTDSAPACIDACIAATGCDAVTYDRWLGHCYQKSVGRGADTLYVLTKADTYVQAPRDRDVRAAQRGEVRILTLENKGYNDPVSSHSRHYARFEPDSLRDCSRACGDACHAFHWDGEYGQCVLFDQPGEFFDREGVIAGYKKQDVPE